MCVCALSGQDTSKGRIKAAAHAKDGDCFGCLITPLRTTLRHFLCHLDMQQDVTYVFASCIPDALPYFTRIMQFNKLRQRQSCHITSHSFTSDATSKLEQPRPYQSNLMTQMPTQLKHTQAKSRVLYRKRCTFICDSTLTASLGSSVTMLKQPMRCPYRPMFLA